MLHGGRMTEGFQPCGLICLFVFLWRRMAGYVVG